MIPGISMASLRRRSSAAPPIDPATLGPSGYWEQRGDINDYSATDTDGGGPDVAGRWEDRGGSSRHWEQATGANRPSVGTAIDGAAPILLDSSGTPRFLPNPNTYGTFGTNAQLVMSLLIKLPASPLPTWNASAQNNPTIITDISGWLTIMYGRDSGVDYIGVAGYDTGWRYARAPITAGQWAQVNMRHIGGELQIEVNGIPASDPGTGIRKSVACGNIGQVTHALTTRNAGVGAVSNYEALSFWFRQTVAADSDFALIRDWWRRAEYPSLAGVLPA